MRKEARELYSRSLDSIFLAVEHFNRPHDRGRIEAVLIFLDRAFELLLKSIIIERGGKIRAAGQPHTIGMADAIRRCVSDVKLACLSEEEALTIQNVNLLRDAGQHYIVSLSEQQLFIHTQAGLSLFKKVISDVFADDLKHHFPERVLPVAAKIPQDFGTVIEGECEEIRKLLRPGARRRLEARAKLRSLAILESSVSGKSEEPTESDMNKLMKRIQSGDAWAAVFPELAKYQLVTSGSGLTVSLRITKAQGDPVALVKQGTPGATVVGVKRVNELDHYSLMPNEIAQKLKLTPPRFLALSRHLELKTDEKFYKEFKIGSQRFGRYSEPALALCKETLKNCDMDQVWYDHRPSGKKKAI